LSGNIVGYSDCEDRCKSHCIAERIHPPNNAGRSRRVAWLGDIDRKQFG
jgi:hypothetical protein